MFIILSKYRNEDQNKFEILSYPSQNGKDRQNNGQQMLEGAWGSCLSVSELVSFPRKSSKDENYPISPANHSRCFASHIE